MGGLESGWGNTGLRGHAGGSAGREVQAEGMAIGRGGERGPELALRGFAR